MDEILLQQQHKTKVYEKSKLHPLVSSVIYLDDGGTSAAPTLIIDEVLFYYLLFYFLIFKNYNFMYFVIIVFGW